VVDGLAQQLDRRLSTVLLHLQAATCVPTAPRQPVRHILVSADTFKRSPSLHDRAGANE
jgi:hypothetical protein